MRRVICGFLTVVVLFLGLPGIGGVGSIAAEAEASRIVQIAAGAYHSLALFSDGSLYAWGWNSDGQLGDGTTDDRSTPVLIGTGYTAIAAGYYHSLALKGSALYAWGLNAIGQLGAGDWSSRSTPTLIGTGFTEIAAGESHSLALKGNTLLAWGWNEDCQLGDGSTTSKNSPQPIGTGYTAIAAGSYHSIALKGSERYGWGRNASGQLGDRSDSNQVRPEKIDSGYTAIAACENFTLFLKGSLLYTCGSNEYGQLGDGTTDERYTPALIGAGYTMIRAGRYHSLALRGSALYAWGANEKGQLGDGTTTQQKTPIMISTGCSAIAAGSFHSLALKGGALYAWGWNNLGQLGDGTTTDRNAPTRVVFPTPASPGPLYIYRFSVKNANPSIGDNAVFTAETGANVGRVKLYRDGSQVASTATYKRKGNRRIWTFSPVMEKSGAFRYWAVATSGFSSGVESADVLVNVSTANLDIQDFTINSPALEVGETVVFKVVTGKLANRVRILESSNDIFAISNKPSKSSGSKKIWTIQRKLTEDDIGSSFNLHAVADSSYGPGLASVVLKLQVTDNLPRIISILPVAATVKSGLPLDFVVATNEATTSVRISNDKKETWLKTSVESTGANRRTWRVTAVPKKPGVRKFYAQAYRGALPGSLVSVRKIRVVK